MNSRAAIALASLALLMSCAAPGRRGERPPPPPQPAQTDRLIVASANIPPDRGQGFYRTGEILFSEGRYSQAVTAYQRFIAGAPPDHRLTDNAYFKIGMSWFEMGRYRDALYYFNAVTQRFVRSEVYNEALINAAICQYHLNDFEEAETAFKRVTGRLSDPGQKAYVFFFLGAIAEKRSDFIEAVGKFVAAERSALTGDLVAASKTKISRIMHNFLSEKELRMLAERYSGEWPAKMALEELMRIYRQNGDTAALAKIHEWYDREFLKIPGKPIAEQPPLGDDRYAPVQIKIAAVLPLSGENAATGREVIQGMRLAFNSFHELIQERGIQLIVKDSGSDPGGARSVVTHIAEDRDVLLVIGPVFSAEFEQAAPVAQRYRLAHLSPTATAEITTGARRRGEGQIPLCL